MGADIPCGIHLCLQQESVVVDVAEAVATIELFESEDLVEAAERIDGSLIEKGTISILRCICS